MLSETLSNELETYRIGEKLRSLRSEKGLGLAQLGEHTGLSAGMLSKIERGQIFPTLPTLLRVSLVFGVGLEHFFTAPETPILEVTRRKDRLRLPDDPNAAPTYLFESLDYPVSERPMEAFLSEFLPRRKASRPHRHPGMELIHVISGVLELSIHGKQVKLEEGDALTFDADHDHAYRCTSEKSCQALVVTTPARPG
ncbi:helix-turn-helix domain-containing protein [Aliiruegeria lutimaris]|uniref:Transcriptional regulator, XRE family with cupin sensor n=1 Tax=Aliiruegeria lutimaris TaxID=571298 RepID=A0A1G9EZ48_9RHOB|nr:XRE family transcriptional regulator [Aliiruegeria lutimaris]SDK81456.1 transcriptional regulator, XRE family with cupin sensor [Aliiruegeria lutimaris]